MSSVSQGREETAWRRGC